MKKIFTYTIIYFFALTTPLNSLATTTEEDQLRIKKRLMLIYEMLENRKPKGLSKLQTENRKRNLKSLKKYWERGKFPINEDHPGYRVPYWIDNHGTYCAAAYIVRESGNQKLALKVAKKFNNSFIEQMNDSDLAHWVSQSGLTLEELQLIQPTYQIGPSKIDIAFKNKDYKSLKKEIAEIKQKHKEGYADYEDYEGDISWYLMKAAMGKGHLGFIKWLIQEGANPNYRTETYTSGNIVHNKPGKTATQLAVIHSDEETVRYLVSKGGDVNLWFDDQKLIYRLVQDGNIKRAKLLLELKTDPNGYGYRGKTILYDNDNYSKVDPAALSRRKKTPTFSYVFGESVLDRALAWQDDEMVKLLKSFGAKTSKNYFKNHQQPLPLSERCLKGNIMDGTEKIHQKGKIVVNYHGKNHPKHTQQIKMILNGHGLSFTGPYRQGPKNSRYNKHYFVVHTPVGKERFWICRLRVEPYILLVNGNRYGKSIESKALLVK